MTLLKCKPVLELKKKGIGRQELFGPIYYFICNEKVITIQEEAAPFLSLCTVVMTFLNHQLVNILKVHLQYRIFCDT